jgi:tRNA U34 5-methylaminomethyl-2-thiouridine-forming methyltransferase MnmC
MVRIALQYQTSIYLPFCLWCHTGIKACIHQWRIEDILCNSMVQTLNVFEMGLGTGLNAFLTAIEAETQKTKIYYTAVEQFPITDEEAKLLNYPDVLGHAYLFQNIHDSKRNEPIRMNEQFTLYKIDMDLLSFSSSQHFNLVYYDAFAPGAQPELWTRKIFEKLFLCSNQAAF